MTHSTVNQLSNLANQLNTDTKQNLQSVTNSAQQIANTIPFTNKNPQVRSYGPRFLAAGSSTAEVIVNGYFAFAAQKNQTPKLLVNGIKISPNLNTTFQPGFSVPMTLLPNPSHTIQEVSLELDAPYEQGLAFKAKGLDSFHLLVSVMPASPVASLVLNTPQPGSVVLQNKVYPPGADQSGTGLYINSYNCQQAQIGATVNADSGWSIIPSSARIVPISIKNETNVKTDVLDNKPDHITCLEETDPSCISVPFGPSISNGSGSINFYLEYTEE